MSSAVIYFAIGVALFALGLHALTGLRNVLRRVIAINVMGTGVFLVLVALASRSTPADPVLQALAVTGLVVAVSASALALRLGAAALQEDAER